MVYTVTASEGTAQTASLMSALGNDGAALEERLISIDDAATEDMTRNKGWEPGDDMRYQHPGSAAGVATRMQPLFHLRADKCRCRTRGRAALWQHLPVQKQWCHKPINTYHAGFVGALS